MAQLSSEPAAPGEWECMECGYVEEGTQARRPEECPECGAPGTAFEFFANEDDEWDSEDELDDEDGDGFFADDEDVDEEDDYE